MDKDEALKPALERCCNHDSDCAVHSMPAYPNEPCDCSLAALAQPAPQPVQPLQELLNVQLLEALKEVINATWVIDSHVVDTDRLIVFREGYDFDGLDGTSREEFLAEHSCIVWKEGSGKWSAYCTHEGSLWFDRFNSVAEAKEACMRLLDKVMPDHPAMKARAVIANTPPLPVQRQPLRAEQFVDIARAITPRTVMGLKEVIPTWIVEYGRAVEAHHNIGDKP